MTTQLRTARPTCAHDLFIDGKFVPAASGKTFLTTNPANGEVVGEIAEGDAADIDRAVAAARAPAENVWSQIPVQERGKLLMRVAKLLQDRMMDIASVRVARHGRPADVDRRHRDAGRRRVRVLGRHGEQDPGRGEPSMMPGESLNYVLREPLGVVGGITPWNGPLIMAAWKTAPAIACGNAVVLKPAEVSPMSALELARLFQEAGAPDGLFNVVPGYGPTAGAALAAHPDVDKIAFTGETSTGQEVARAARSRTSNSSRSSSAASRRTSSSTTSTSTARSRTRCSASSPTPGRSARPAGRRILRGGSTRVRRELVAREGDPHRRSVRSDDAARSAGLAGAVRPRVELREDRPRGGREDACGGKRPDGAVRVRGASTSSRRCSSTSTDARRAGVKSSDRWAC